MLPPEESLAEGEGGNAPLAELAQARNVLLDPLGPLLTGGERTGSLRPPAGILSGSNFMKPAFGRGVGL